MDMEFESVKEHAMVPINTTAAREHVGKLSGMFELSRNASMHRFGTSFPIPPQVDRGETGLFRSHDAKCPNR